MTNLWRLDPRVVLNDYRLLVHLTGDRALVERNMAKWLDAAALEAWERMDRRLR